MTDAIYRHSNPKMTFSEVYIYTVLTASLYALASISGNKVVENVC